MKRLLDLTEEAGRSCTNGFLGPKKVREFRETGPMLPTYYQLGSLSLQFTVFLESSKVLHAPQFTFLPDQPTLSV